MCDFSIWRKFGVLLAYFEKIRFCKANDIKGFEKAEFIWCSVKIADSDFTKLST